MKYPKISVIIPAYNAANFLVETLESVFNQNYPNVEVLVIDDGSTDNTSSVIEPFRDRLTFIQQANWGGPSQPRNVGIKNSTGEFISFFDSDDIMLPDKLSRSAAVLMENSDIDFVFTNFRGVDEKGHVIRPDYLVDYRNFRADLEACQPSGCWSIPGNKAFTNLISANFIGTSSVLCRKSVFEVTGLLDEAMLNADDADMWGRIAFAGSTFAFIDDVFHSYRMRGGGVTGRRERRYPSILKVTSKKLSLDLSASDRVLLEKKHLRLQLGYGRALREAGEFAKSRQIYRRALQEKILWSGVKGWIHSLMRSLTPKWN